MSIKKNETETFDRSTKGRNKGNYNIPAPVKLSYLNFVLSLLVWKQVVPSDNCNVSRSIFWIEVLTTQSNKQWQSLREFETRL